MSGKVKRIFIGTCIYAGCYGQITQIYTGTNENMIDLSLIGNKVVVCATKDFIGTCTGACHSLTPLSSPSPTGFGTRLMRMGAGKLYLVSYSPSGSSVIYKSSDCGGNWSIKSTIAASYSRKADFFDSSDVFLTDGQFMSRSVDDCTTWTNVPQPLAIGLTALKTYSDSIVCIGGYGTLSGGFKMSKDRGKTWPYGGVLWSTPSNFFFLNKDTVFAISSGGEFSKTTNGGVSWNLSPTSLLSSQYGIYFRNHKEGFVVGSDANGKGLIVRTTDIGETWEAFNTGINTTFMSIVWINDTLSYLSGTNGVLIKWNYKKTIFTDLDENADQMTFTVYPNPTKGVLHYKGHSEGIIDAELFDCFGRLLFTDRTQLPVGGWNIDFIAPGVYFLKLNSENGSKVVKIVRE